MHCNLYSYLSDKKMCSIGRKSNTTISLSDFDKKKTKLMQSAIKKYIPFTMHFWLKKSGGSRPQELYICSDRPRNVNIITVK